jgi:serine/threonine protein kinase
LDWKKRLKIAVDAAAGIEYLHNGSNTKIIHRDVKCSNILLDSDLNAKVCDFGLSKQIVQADATHVTTVVKGTAGYLDPEYYSTQQLTEKSDVYSFGVVLLELICGREPLTHTGSPDTYNLVLWAKPYLQAGDYNVVDKNLQNNYSTESLKRVASIASRCVERDASQRPTMAEVLSELKESLAIEETENPTTEEI